MKRIIVGISGASGVIIGYRLLEALGAHPEVERHLVVSDNAKLTWQQEAKLPLDALLSQAEVVHPQDNMAAAISSGSFITDGMIIAPCSMKTLAGLVSGYSDNLLLRAADVCLKENRKVVLVPREMPLGKLHLRNLSTAADLGCVIIPPMLSFYIEGDTVEAQLAHITGRILMQFGLAHKPFHPWEGLNP